jgi:hypothetical protein
MDAGDRQRLIDGRLEGCRREVVRGGNPNPLSDHGADGHLSIAAGDVLMDVRVGKTGERFFPGQEEDFGLIGLGVFQDALGNLEKASGTEHRDPLSWACFSGAKRAKGIIPRARRSVNYPAFPSLTNGRPCV